MSIRNQCGDKATVKTVGELRSFMADYSDDMEISMGMSWDEIIEVCPMKESDSGKMILCFFDE